MKKFIAIILMISVGLFMAVSALAGGNIFTIEMSGVTVDKDTTGTYRTMNLNNVWGAGPVKGDCTFTIQDVVVDDDLSGTTVSFYYRQYSKDDVWGWLLAQQVPIVTSLAWDSGTTKYGYPLDLNLQQYLRIEMTAGVADCKANIGLTFQAPGGK